MAWWSDWRRTLRWRLVRGTRFPKGNLRSCLLNLKAQGFAPRHIIDVGANVARWSGDAQTVFPDCRYTLIEPQRELEPKLARFCRGKPNRRYVIAGAGATSGQMLLTIKPDCTASNFVTSREWAAARGFVQRPALIVSLDELAETNHDPPADLIKIDAEGMEHDVLKGARRMLAHTELVFLEAHLLARPGDPSDFAALAGYMSELGFAVYDFTWFGARGRDGAPKLCEVVFSRRDGFFRKVREAAAA